MADTPSASPELACIAQQERALGIGSELSALQSANAQILRELAERAPSGYADALASDAPLPSLQTLTDLPLRTRIEQATARYRGNIASMRSYDAERQSIRAGAGAGLAACHLDAIADPDELSSRVSRLLDAKFKSLALELVGRLDLGNRFSLYSYQGEGGYALFSRVPGTSKFAYDPAEPDDRPLEDMWSGTSGDEIFFPTYPERADQNPDGKNQGYFFSTERVRVYSEDRKIDMAAVDGFLRMTPDDVLRTAEKQTGLMREADRRNAALVERARSLVQEVNASDPPDYHLELNEERTGWVVDFIGNASSRPVTYFTVPSWGVSGSELALDNSENELTRAYVEGIVAKLRKERRL